MAKLVQSSLLLVSLMAFLSVSYADQPQLSEAQTLLEIYNLLNFPSPLTSLNDNIDFCNFEPTSSLTLVCYESNLTQLHIYGNDGFPQLPQGFSTESFFATLANLSNLKVLSLNSLGLWGSLPSNIGRFSSLEILNLSSNYFSGDIPVELSHLGNLQTLVLDHNNFTGQAPLWISELPLLSVLSLKNNLLTGSLPNSLGTLQNLRVLSLAQNNFSGDVPDLSKLTNLQILNLEDNKLGPHFPGLPTKSLTIVLRNNRFGLGIPAKVSSFYLLQKLDISHNGFVGPFSPSLLSLPSITYLDIAGNKLTGVLWQNMSCSSELSFVNLSSNYLVGDLPECLLLDSKRRVVVYSRNCLSNDDQKQKPSKFCHKEALAVQIVPGKEKHKEPNSKPAVVSSVAGGIVGAITVFGLVSMLIRWIYGKGIVRKPLTRSISVNVSTVNTAKLLSDAKYISETMKLGASLPAYRTFALEELKEATNNFDASTLIGESSHGQIYRGKLSDGTLVAIRSLKASKKQSPQAYTHHIELISKLRHHHLVSALGHCLEYLPDDSFVSRIFLVFEFAPNGTLRDCISGTPGKKLSWTQRIAAAIGVTKAVQFLHTGIVPGVYSNNLKIRNVLMDNNFHVKISSYNLPLLVENRRTVGYLGSSPASKGSGQDRVQNEDKNDVYDIGVILLEIILGRPVMFQYEVGALKDLVGVSLTTDDTGRRSIVDPAVHKQCSEESLKTMMEICLRCLSNEPADRPSIEDILSTLQFAAQVQDSGRVDSINSQESHISLF